MTIYYVNGWNFTHYGAAKSFARQIGANVIVTKTYNPFKMIVAAMN